MKIEAQQASSSQPQYTWEQIRELERAKDLYEKYQKAAILRQYAVNLEFTIQNAIAEVLRDHREESASAYFGECGKRNVFAIKQMDIQRGMNNIEVRGVILKEFFKDRPDKFENFRKTLRALKGFSYTGAHPVTYNDLASGKEVAVTKELVMDFIGKTDYEWWIKKHAIEFAWWLPDQVPFLCTVENI